MINTVIEWLEIIQQDHKRAISIANLVETMWLDRYCRPTEITHDQGLDDFTKYLIE